MAGMKTSLQRNKYIRFLIISTAISLTLFILNITVGFDQAQARLRLKHNDKYILVTEEYVKGDIRGPTHAGSAESAPVLMEETPEYKIKQFWSHFAELLKSSSPAQGFKLEKVRPEKCRLETNLIDPVYDGELYSEKFLGECLNMNYEVYKGLIDLHAKFVNKLPEGYGDGGAADYYHGDGIVMIGGGKYSVMTQLVISIMRQRGTQLPVEVMIPHGETDDNFCSNLSKMNAKCIRPLIDEQLWKSLKIDAYQIKIVSMLSTTFRNVLYLDSDSYPLQSMDGIFEAEAFKETGFISWPDFWRRSTSPAFFQISGKTVGGVTRNNIDEFTPVDRYTTGHENLFQDVSYHDRAGTIPDGSSETSVIMMDKIRHARTLMLSFYYNYNGPNLYYYLLSQGNFGQGDKETFVAAAHVLDMPYYQVKTKPIIGGELLFKGKTPRGAAMIQFDPRKDYELYKEAKQKFGNPAEGASYDIQQVVNFFNDQNKNGLFIHYNLGKMDPLMLDNFERRRYGYDLRDVGFDFELQNMELMNSMICGGSNTKIEFQYLRGANKDEICRKLADILKTMNETRDKVLIN